MELCNILKVGKFTDSKGNEHDFTTETLDKIVHNFESVHKDVPICVGHPKTNSPAYGWIDSVKRIGDNLYCSFKNVQDEFKDAVKKGLFKNRSVSLDKDLNLRHLAFLGGACPAVKGLEQFCFSDDETAVDIEWSDFEDLATVANTVDRADVERIKKELANEQAKNAELKKQINEQNENAKRKEFEDFCDKAIERGNILPKHKDCVINILSSADKTGTFNFADSDEDAVESVKKFISDLKMIDFSDEITNAEEITDFSDYSADDWVRAINNTKCKALSEGRTIDTVTAINIIKKGKK